MCVTSKVCVCGSVFAKIEKGFGNFKIYLRNEQ